jgi:hypothetical protein
VDSNTPYEPGEISSLNHPRFLRWGQRARFGDLVVQAIQEIVVLFPDGPYHAKATRELDAAEHTQRTLNAAAAKELREHMLVVFNGCYDAVLSQREPVQEPTRKTKRPREPRQICKLFLQLPKSNVGLCLALIHFYSFDFVALRRLL